MAYKGIDISSWDSRTQRLVAKYGLANAVFDRWMQKYHGNLNLVELEYLNNIALRVKNLASGYVLSYGCEDKTAISYCQEAKGIFELLGELASVETTDQSYHALYQVEECHMILKGLDDGPNGISQESVFSDDPSPGLKIGGYSDDEDNFQKLSRKPKRKHHPTTTKAFISRLRR